MSKFLLTEKQLENLKKNVNEQSDNSKYEMTCSVDLEFHNATFKHQQIDDISTHDINCSFDIDMEGRSWGIKSISVYNVKGNEQLELTVSYYQNDSDEPMEETVSVTLDWEDVNYEENDDLGYIGIDDTVTISLGNDSDGNLVVDTITVGKKDI